jgi:hypothetical protein
MFFLLKHTKELLTDRTDYTDQHRIDLLPITVYRSPLSDHPASALASSSTMPMKSARRVILKISW